jgi:hypothetical protein
MDSFQHRGDVTKLQERVKQARDELEKLFEADAQEQPKERICMPTQ